MPEKVGFSRLKLVRNAEMPPPPVERSPYVELGVTTPFSFLRGASDAIELVLTALKLGTKKTRKAPVLESRQTPVDLEKLPLLQLWHEDGGHFVTLPLVNFAILVATFVLFRPTLGAAVFALDVALLASASWK